MRKAKKKESKLKKDICFLNHTFLRQYQGEISGKNISITYKLSRRYMRKKFFNDLQIIKEIYEEKIFQ